MLNLPDFDAWLYAQADKHMERRISDNEDDSEDETETI